MAPCLQFLDTYGFDQQLARECPVRSFELIAGWWLMVSRWAMLGYVGLYGYGSIPIGL